MKVIYVAGPFRGKNAWEVEQNVRRAETFAMMLAEKGFMPLCPHSNTRFFDGTLTADFWVKGTLELMRRCDGVMVCDTEQGALWRASTGTCGEVEEAKRLGLPVRFAGDKLDF